MRRSWTDAITKAIQAAAESVVVGLQMCEKAQPPTRSLPQSAAILQMITCTFYLTKLVTGVVVYADQA
jgi:hypothetical protein